MVWATRSVNPWSALLKALDCTAETSSDVTWAVWVRDLDPNLATSVSAALLTASLKFARLVEVLPSASSMVAWAPVEPEICASC